MYLKFNGRKANLCSHQFAAFSLPPFLTSFFSRFTSLAVSVVCLFIFLANVGWAQPWTYDFGTGTGTHTINTASTSFLPAPTSGISRVRVGTNPGSISLVNPGISLGTGSELQITSNTSSASTTKFSVYDFTASKSGYVKFKIAFNGGTNGVYNFTIGDGTNFSDNLAIGTAQIFSGLRWSLLTSNAVTYQVLNNNVWGTTGITSSTTLFSQSTSNEYLVEIYYNNTTGSLNYDRSGSTYSVANAKWDLWVDGTLRGDDLAKAALGTDVNIDSYAFNHQVSASAPGTIYIDDIEYSNILPTSPSITLADNGSQVSASSVAAGSTNVILHQSSLAVTTANATLTGVSFTTAGTYTAADVSNFKVWYSADNSFATTGDNTQLGSAITTSLGAGAKSVSSLSQAINSGSTGYIFITTDIAASPTGGNTINVSALTTSDVTFSSGTKSGSTTAGGAKTFQSASSPTLNAVTLASALSSTYGTASVGVSFTANGSNLTAENITATAQPGYEVSTSLGSGYGASVSVSSGTTVYVRFTSAQSAGNYNNATGVILSGGGAASNANVTTSSSGNTVSQKALTVTGLTAQNKVYDGLTTATTTGTATLSGIVGADAVSLSGTPSYTFASANVGSSISVSTSGYTLTGAQSTNYSITQPTLAANITERPLSITANNVAKAFGSSLSGGSGSTAFTSSGLQNGETIGSVTIAYGSGAAAGDAVGTYSGSVTPSLATGGTFISSNYSISYVSGDLIVSNYAVGDYRTRVSGNWGINTTWEKWNGSAWVACSSGDFPDVSTASVTIQIGHTVDNDGSGTPPWDVNNLTVETGGKLWDNSFNGGNSYIQLYGDVVCNGTIGDPNGDDISFDIAGGNDCTISGTGSFTATRLRKDATINSTTDASLTIDMDVRLTWSSSSGAVLYNDGSASNFNVTINSGRIVRGSGPGSALANVAIDGNNFSTPDLANSGGTVTVNGTLDIDGILYAYTNNSLRPCEINISNGGTVKCRYIRTGNSGSAGSTLRIFPGGKLNIFGSVDTVSATLVDTTWRNFSTTNNTWDFQSGSTIEYSGATQQKVNGITTCSNFIVSGGGLKKLGNDFTVAGMLTLTNGRIQTDAYKLIHTSTSAADLTHTTGSSSFIFGTYRRYIASNSSTYELPVGLSSATSGYRRADILNNNLSGVTYIDASVRSITETANNIDSRLSTTQIGSSLTDVLGASVWSLVPNAQPSVGTYGVNLYVANTGLSSADDNTFCAVKRNDNSTDYADWNTFYASTTIPSSGAPGRMYDSGNGYAQRLGYTSFSEHALGKTPANQPLPIELNMFDAFCQEKGKTTIKWSTATEHNTAYFQLDRSNNGLEWQALGSVGAAVNSDEEIQYNFEDRNNGGLLYYRLHQVDINGGEQMYGPVSVHCENNVYEINTFPNPSSDDFNVSIFSESDLVSCNVQVLDAKGMVVDVSTKSLNKGSNEFEIMCEKWLPGVYFIEVIFEDGNMYRKKHVVM